MQEILNRVQEQLNENWAVDKEDIQALVNYVENDRWISVDKKTPPLHTRVLALVNGREVEFFYDNPESSIYHYVSHWKPLQKPPK